MAAGLNFPGQMSRLQALRLTLLIATLFGMLACLPLWLTSRPYPLVPVGGWLPSIPAFPSQVIYGTLLTSLLLACRYGRFAVVFFLSGSAFLFLFDQNRCQPWFYMYWIMLLLTLLPEKESLAGCRVTLSAVYLWSGIQKCNLVFFQAVVPWFAQPASAWLPKNYLPAVQWIVASAPFVEMFIGLALWISWTRRGAIIAVILVHVTALVFLGPLGHKYNLVVWPWNLAMIALACILFPFGPMEGNFSRLRRSSIGFASGALVSLLPILSYFGWWDSYMSFALYSGNLATADVYITESFRTRLPASMQQFVHPLDQYDATIQGPFVFDHQAWAMAVLRTPPLPEPRGFRVMFQYLKQYSAQSEDLRMVVSPRSGPVMFYQGDNSLVLNFPKN